MYKSLSWIFLMFLHYLHPPPSYFYVFALFTSPPSYFWCLYIIYSLPHIFNVFTLFTPLPHIFMSLHYLHLLPHIFMSFNIIHQICCDLTAWPWFWSIVLYLLVIVYILNVCSMVHVVMTSGFVAIKTDFQIHIQNTIS